MPRTRGKYRNYTQETLETAMFKVQNRECSMRRASIDYGIPRTTLFDKLCGNTPLISTQGPSPVLTYTEENKLAHWLKNMSRIGYGQTRQQLKMMVKKILDEDGRHNPFKNNTPGNDWFRRFKRRHPGLTERVGESLGKERAMLSVKKLDKWFAELESYLEEDGGGVGIMADPTRIFNCDESGFPLNGKTMKVLAPMGCRTVYQLTNSDKSQITVLACMSAAGTYVPPMLIFPGQRFKYNPLRGTPDNWFLGRSDSGWIDQEVFYEWIANHFVPTVKRANIEFPVILFMDGHRSHINLETANFCAENKVILYCFPAHASHILQPCDLSLFKSLKNNWKKEVQQWQVDNPGQNVTKQNFASIFYHAWKDSTFTITARNGFKAAGLYPFTKAFDHAKVAPSEVFQQQEEEESDDDGMPILSPVKIYDFDDMNEDPDSELRLSQAGFVSPIRQRNSHAAGLARKALESTFTPEKLWVYEKRFREGFDVETDELYNTWKKLKVQETNQAPQPPRYPNSPSKSSVLTSTYVSPCLEQYLRYPRAPESRRPVKVRKELPKAISGLKYRQYLEDKISAKEELERTKKEKKEIREAKKVEKGRLQKEKQKRMEEKKNNKGKKLPVCRKLLVDPPSNEVPEDNERDVYGGMDTPHDTMANEQPCDEEGDNLRGNEQRDVNILLANTVVSLELDDSIVFPQPPKKRRPSTEEGVTPQLEATVRPPHGGVESGPSCGVVTHDDIPSLEEDKNHDRGGDEQTDDGDENRNTVPAMGEGDRIVEPPVIALGPLLPLSGDDGRIMIGMNGGNSRQEEEPPSLDMVEEGTSSVIKSMCQEGDVPLVADKAKVMSLDATEVEIISEARLDAEVSEPGEIDTMSEATEVDLVIVEDEAVTESVEASEATGTTSLDAEVGEVLAKVMEEISSITSSEREDKDVEGTSRGVGESVAFGEDTSTYAISEEEDDISDIIAERASNPDYGQLAPDVGSPGTSGIKKESGTKKRKKEKMRMMKKGTKRSYYEEEETKSSLLEQQFEKDDWTLIDENVCDVCQESYCGNDDDWVGCEWCPRWFHKECTDIADIAGMSEQEINSVDWYCHHCM